MVRARRAYGGANGYAHVGMPFVLVALVSVLVGLAVYLGTVRGQETPATALGFGEPDETEVEAIGSTVPAPGYAYLQVSTRGPGLRDRLLGVAGLLLLIGFSAAVLAFAIYEMGHLINRTIEAFLQK
jgi:hypothetical protein